MSNAATALAIRDDQIVFDEWQEKALAHMGVQNATKADLAVFFHQSKRTGLDPFARQIHMIGRNTKNPKTDQWETKFTIQTGIDGYRLIARRAAGQSGYGYEDTLWCGADGQWVEVWAADEAPHAAKVVVVRDGKRFPAVARYKAYVQTKRDGKPNSIWVQRDAEQLEKCAEALALRKAFPQDLSGLYTEDELRASSEHPEAPEVEHQTAQPVTAADFLTPTEDGDTVDAEVVEEPAVDFITDEQRGKLFALFREAGIISDARTAEGKKARLDYIAYAIGRHVDTTNALTRREASVVIEMLLSDARTRETLPIEEPTA
jgi:phage recombination protein Bet